MKKHIRLLLTVWILLVMVSAGRVSVLAEDREDDYEKDYMAKVFDSEKGLEGTAVKCICASEDGFIWLGGYTGLYRYDGTEFKKYLINDRLLTVNDVIQDKDGNLWVGTNGNGLYCFDGEEFVRYSPQSEREGEDIINKLFADADGTIYAATKNGLLFVDPKKEEEKAERCEELTGMILRDIQESEHGEKIIIEKSGKIFLLNNGKVTQMELTPTLEQYVPRCCSPGKDKSFYIGTTGNCVLKVSSTGEVLCVLDGEGLSTFNGIYEFEEGKYWICSDTGVGILENDTIKKLKLPIEDSIEEACTDYQGNFWFSSSRQGAMQLFKNGFSDLGSYWGITQTVNSIQKYGNKEYVGCDNGLFCFVNSVPVNDNLVEECKGERIRQVYKDREENLWVSTYRGGIRVLRNDGKIVTFDSQNSGLDTDQIRCIKEASAGNILIGTEDGLYVLNEGKEIKHLTDNEVLCSQRILDVTEYNGAVYAATDGYGVYEIRDGEVENVYSKEQGLPSGVVMKVVPSVLMQGVWLVTGEEICFINSENKIEKVKGIELANSLDLLITERGDVVILAGNGVFCTREDELLEEWPNYSHITKQDGIPVDFTANARNTIEDGILYICGTTGAASFDIQYRPSQNKTYVYLNEVTVDGDPVDINENKVVIPANAYRVNIDVRPIDYIHQNLKIGYCLEGVDQEETYLEDDDIQEISYTNLKGGTYTYLYQVFDPVGRDCINYIEFTLQKSYHFWEEPRIKVLLVLILAAAAVFLQVLVSMSRENSLKKRYHVKFLKEKEEELAKMAYMDLVTGAYNRNWFEQRKETLDMSRMYAFFAVSVNHEDYLRSKHGNFFMEGVLRTAAEVLRECTSEETELYRVSENVFYFWFEKQVNLESYIKELKEKFQEKGEAEGLPFSFSVGAVYNNTVDKEKLADLINRCEKIRLLDEKHAETRFIEGKMKLL